MVTMSNAIPDLFKPKRQSSAFHVPILLIHSSHNPVSFPKYPSTVQCPWNLTHLGKWQSNLLNFTYFQLFFSRKVSVLHLLVARTDYLLAYRCFLLSLHLKSRKVSLGIVASIFNVWHVLAYCGIFNIVASISCKVFLGIVTSIFSLRRL